MKINLNDPQALTLESVRKLIASKDDSAHRQLRVNKDGFAFLSDAVGINDIDNIMFRFETWSEGHGYCGKTAAMDEQWVNNVFCNLKENWPIPKADYINT